MSYSFWAGVGEVLLRHDDLTNLTIGEVARVNHPGLFEILKFCGDNHMPINIHQNCTAVGRTEEFEYVHELRVIVDKFPKTTQSTLAGTHQKYPDRFMIGSDLCDHFDTYGKTIGRYNQLFELLPEQVATMVARENDTRLWFSKGKKEDVIPRGFSARTLVYEYGGGSFAVSDGKVIFFKFFRG